MKGNQSPVHQLFIGLTEDASAHLEALLAEQTCAQHTDTTLDGGECAMCNLDFETNHNIQPFKPVWVRRAEASLLPPKVIQ